MLREERYTMVWVIMVRTDVYISKSERARIAAMVQRG